MALHTLNLEILEHSHKYFQDFSDFIFQAIKHTTQM